MTEHEGMLHWWTATLILVLEGFTMASVQMERVGEEKKIIEVFMEDMLYMMGGYTPEQKRLLVIQFALLSGLALRVESPS